MPVLQSSQAPVRYFKPIALALLFLSISVLGSRMEAAQVAGGGPYKSYNLREFDPSCGQAGHNCQRAFQFAFQTIAKAGGGTLQLPAGTFSIDFPGVAQNILGRVTISPQSLLSVPPNTMIEGHLDANGAPDSIIEWRNTSIPTFVFAKANHSGLRNLHLRFTGSMAKLYPFGDIALLTALGYHPTFPHYNQMSGGNGELFSFAYVFDSDGCTFDHLLFDSATQDNDHVFGMAINIKAKGVIENNGGGLTQLAESNRITNVQVYDFLNAFLIAGQNNFAIENITADRRGSMPNTAPGHVLYTTGTNQFDAAAKIVNMLLSTNTTVRNISEGPHTYSNAVAGGTLAIKFLKGARISNVKSQHPEGLIQTIYADQDVTFSNLSWKSDYPLCTTVPSNCSTPVIYSTQSPANFPPTRDLTFQNISLVSTANPSTVVLIGDNLRVDGLQITTPPDFLPGQKATNAVLSVKSSNGAVIKGYVFTPVLHQYNPAGKYNTPFTGWNSSRNVSAEVTINWPGQIPKPDLKAAIVASGYQDKSPQLNNSVRSSMLKR
jgi:hypothetical protein